MIRTELLVDNKLGLHARAAAKVVSVASRYNASIRIGTGKQMIDAKSIMGLLTLGAAKGSHLQVEIEGDDAQQALEELQKLFADRFDEGE